MLPLGLGFGAVVISASLLASMLRLRSAVSFLLTAYVIVWTEIVVVAFALSAGKWVVRGSLVATFLALAAGSLFVWALAGRPRPPPLARAVRRGLRAASDPLVALPLTVSAVALSYALVVTLTTAHNDGDPLAYELTRAAFWRQEHGIVILDAVDSRIDFSPPVAETALLAIMTLSGSEQFTGLAQWSAVPALVLATYGVGLRIGLDRRPALWGAALVPAFPIVIAQSWSAFTDLVFGSFAVIAVYFGLGALGVELIPLGLSVGLALGTKFLGPIFAPLFLLIAGVAQPVRRWKHVTVAAVAGAALASLWYLRTLLAVDHPVGNEGAGAQSRELAPVVTTFQLLTSEIFDLSGAAGRDVWLYVIVGGSLVGVAASVARRERYRTSSRALLLAGLLVGATPFLVSLVGKAHARSGLLVGEALGRPDLVDQLRDWRPSDVSDGAFSWFGPVGAMIVSAAVGVAVVEVRRRRLRPVALVLAGAPLLAIGLVSLTVSYLNHEGRYFVAPLALCLATCGGFALRHRWAATALGGVATVTVLLVLVNSLGKPSGVGILRGDPGRSVWSMPRWEQQGILRSTPPERDEVMTIRFVHEHVPRDAVLGTALVANSLLFPYFGSELSRKITMIGEDDVVPDGVDWIAAAPGQRVRGCPRSWRRERLGPYGWRVWRRVAADSCAAAGSLDSG